jgi:hypothetical protein
MVRGGGDLAGKPHFPSLDRRPAQQTAFWKLEMLNFTKKKLNMNSREDYLETSEEAQAATIEYKRSVSQISLHKLFALTLLKLV